MSRTIQSISLSLNTEEEKLQTVEDTLRYFSTRYFKYNLILPMTTLIELMI